LIVNLAAKPFSLFRKVTKMSKKICYIIGYGPGVGQGTAEAFASAGFELVLFSRSGRAAKEPLTGESVQVDAGSETELRSALETAISKFGAPEVLVYNAVAFRQALPTQLEPTDLIEDFRTNVVGALVASQTVLPSMRAKGGSLLFTGGGWALYPDANVSSTAIGKASLRHLTLMLAQELKQTKVKVGTLTILGHVQPGSAFDPDQIGKRFLAMHQSDSLEPETTFAGG
jgi:NAD(P)-dependent dehydrogenase (short-subunit alcohol dehydrogenase family)